VGTYYANANTVVYTRSNMVSTFGHGTMDGYYWAPGDGCPLYADDALPYLVDLRYEVSVPITPGMAAPFVQGVWAGQVTVASALSNMVLWAEDPYGHYGRSTPFQVRGAVTPPWMVPESAGMTAGGFRMELTGLEASGTVVIECSTNLVDWRAVYTNEVLTAPVIYNDAGATNGYRFYRALIR
jgi:hypothetical protein